MTVYQFDKAALERLRDDVLENPLKYEEMLKKAGYSEKMDNHDNGDREILGPEGIDAAREILGLPWER
jgi:hypothetical protein